MCRIKIILALLAAGAAQLAWSQVTIDDCQRLAAENYPEIRQYDILRLTEKLTLEAIDKEWLPQISVGAQASWQTEVPTLPNALTNIVSSQGLGISGMKKDQYKVSLDLYQPIWDGGKSRAERIEARAEADADAAGVDVELYAVRERVNNLYFGTLLLNKQAGQLKLTAELLEANLAKLRSMVRNGAAMQSDVDEVEAEALTVKQRTTECQATAEAYCRMLSVFIGREVRPGDLEMPMARQPVQTENRRPELAAFAARSASLTAQENLVKASLMPSVGFFAQGYVGYPSMNYFESMLNSRWRWNAMLGVKVSWNIGAFYTRRNSLRKIRNAQEEIAVQRDVFLFNTRLNMEEESQDIRRLQAVIEDDNRIVELRQSVRKAAESQLQNGVIDATRLLQRITDEMQAAIARSSHQVELAKAIYQLRHTINQ